MGGRIIAFIKISRCVSSVEGRIIDAKYCDAPFAAKSHWAISDVLALSEAQYVSARGRMGCANIANKALNAKLKRILQTLLRSNSSKNGNENENENESAK